MPFMFRSAKTVIPSIRSLDETVAEVLDYVQYNPKKMVRGGDLGHHLRESRQDFGSRGQGALSNYRPDFTDTPIWNSRENVKLLYQG